MVARELPSWTAGKKMVLQHAGGVGRCAEARGMEPVYGDSLAAGIRKLSDSLCLSLKTAKRTALDR